MWGVEAVAAAQAVDALVSPIQSSVGFADADAGADEETTQIRSALICERFRGRRPEHPTGYDGQAAPGGVFSTWWWCCSATT
jgi:hypothetical protein